MIAIDDFGTGYSSLAYLRQFPVDVLKIDRSFIAEMDGSPNSAALIHTLVELGRTLGLITLAEGIEDHTAARGVAGRAVRPGPGVHHVPAGTGRRHRGPALRIGPEPPEPGHHVAGLRSARSRAPFRAGRESAVELRESGACAPGVGSLRHDGGAAAPSRACAGRSTGRFPWCPSSLPTTSSTRPRRFRATTSSPLTGYWPKESTGRAPRGPGRSWGSWAGWPDRSRPKPSDGWPMRTGRCCRGTTATGTGSMSSSTTRRITT